MIKFQIGSIFDVGADAIVNPVNCVGVMGAGLAKRFKKEYPEMFLEYKALCDSGILRIGRMYVWKDESSGKYIINFPTKKHWEERTYVDYLEEGFQELVKMSEALMLKKVAIPALGCGLGGLSFVDFYKVAKNHLSKSSVQFFANISYEMIAGLDYNDIIDILNA